MEPPLTPPRAQLDAMPYFLEVHVGPGDFRAEMARDVSRGLSASPKELQPKCFYDARGSALFEQITELPEYYQTRTERSILERIAPEVITRYGIDEVVELGAGSARKTETPLRAMHACNASSRYIPFDVDPHMLLDTAGRVSALLPGLGVHAVAGDFERHLGTIPVGAGMRLVVFLGGTIGNFSPSSRGGFISTVAQLLDPGDLLLVGTDLVGDVERIEAAYNDAAGVTSDFNLNALKVLNRELGADLDLDHFVHDARYDHASDCIEMFARATAAQTVRVGELDLEVDFALGEEMRTEISCKFTRESAAQMYESGGLKLAEWHTDPKEWFAVSLAIRD
ncbi:MAG: L-histidine N(alpha)-methyltransferase [Thermoleophilia bacterium]|nr:L-histidine N(alpha)-methyltransferase [Thermoleophilia bacterium]